MKRPTWRSWLAIFMLALGLRLVAAWWWQSRLAAPFGFGDSEGYWVLGRAVARGEPYCYGPVNDQVFRTPGYPVLLAPLFLFSQNDPPIMAARAEGALFGAMGALGVGWLAHLLFGPRAGLLGAAIAAVYPGAIALSVFVLSEAPFCPLVVLQLALWIIAWQAPTRGRAGTMALVAGLAAGAATLVRPTWLPFVPFAAGLGLLFGRQRWRHVGIGAAMMVGLILVMLPWWIRNYRVVGHFVPTSLQVGAGLYNSWNPKATGASDMSFVPEVLAREREHPGAAGGSPDDPLEYRLGARYKTEAIAWAKAHPGRVLELAAINVSRMWNVWPNEPSLSSWPIRLAVAATYLPILVLAIWGTIRWSTGFSPRSDSNSQSGGLKPVLRHSLVLCWLPAIYLTLLHLVFASSIRYREPAMLPLVALAAGIVAAQHKPEPQKPGLEI